VTQSDQSEPLAASREEAAKVVADLHAKAEAHPKTRQGTRAAQNLYNTASAVEQLYGIGFFAEDEPASDEEQRP